MFFIGRTDGQTDVQLKTLVRNLTMNKNKILLLWAGDAVQARGQQEASDCPDRTAQHRTAWAAQAAHAASPVAVRGGGAAHDPDAAARRDRRQGLPLLAEAHLRGRHQAGPLHWAWRVRAELVRHEPRGDQAGGREQPRLCAQSVSAGAEDVARQWLDAVCHLCWAV